MLSVYIFYIAPAFVLFPIATGALYYKHLSPSYRILFFYTVLSAVTNLVAIILSATSHKNLLLLRFYTVFEYLFVAAFFRAQFLRYKLNPSAISVSMLIFPLLCMADLFFQTPVQFDSYTSSLEAVLINLLCLILLNHIGSDKIPSTWSKNPVNWFNTGMLLYFSGSMFLFLLSNFLMTAPPAISYAAWAMHGTLSLSMYIMFSIGFLKCKN